MTKIPTTAETLEPELPLTVYHRLSRRDASLKDALEHTIGSVIAHRWHILQTFKRDFTSQSNLTRGGALWNYILPLVPLGAYVLLMAMRLFPSFGAVNAVVYITFGATLYFLFSGLVRIPITVLEGQFDCKRLAADVRNTRQGRSGRGDLCSLPGLPLVARHLHHRLAAMCHVALLQPGHHPCAV